MKKILLAVLLGSLLFLGACGPPRIPGVLSLDDVFDKVEKYDGAVTVTVEAYSLSITEANDLGKDLGIHVSLYSSYKSPDYWAFVIFKKGTTLDDLKSLESGGRIRLRGTVPAKSDHRYLDGSTIYIKDAEIIR